MDNKAKDLQMALDMGKWDNPCDNHECWDGIRCAQYCEVALFCPKGLIEKGGK